MTHDELVQHAVDWLRSRGKQQPHGQHHVVFAELSTIVTSETPDAIGWNAAGVSTLVEEGKGKHERHTQNHPPSDAR